MLSGNIPGAGRCLTSLVCSLTILEIRLCFINRDDERHSKIPLPEPPQDRKMPSDWPCRAAPAANG
jgi:hypothetical protein